MRRSCAPDSAINWIGVGVTLHVNWYKYEVAQQTETVWCAQKAALFLLVANAILWAGIILPFRYIFGRSW